MFRKITIDQKQVGYFLCQMAKQGGRKKIEGTIDGVCFYKMNDQYFARSKPSLSGKRFWKDKAFAGSRSSAISLGEASKMAAIFYKRLDEESKSRIVYQKLTGKIKLLLEAGFDESFIELWFEENYMLIDHINDLRKQRTGNENNELLTIKLKQKAA